MTVSLFGHRILQNSVATERALFSEINNLLSKEEFVDFLIGRDGDFDLLAASVIRRVIQKTDRENAALTLVLPFPRAEISKNEQAYSSYYDHIEICDAAETAYYKAAFWIRNQDMINRSDLVIVCLEHSGGGTARAANYAKSCKIPVLNLFEIPS